MTLAYDVLNNGKVVLGTFLPLIKEECERIERHGLLSRKDLQAFIGHKLSSVGTNADDNQIIQLLSDIHAAIKNVKIAGDKLPVFDIIVVDLPVSTEIAPNEECPCLPDCDCEKHEDEAHDKVAQIVYFLEKLADAHGRIGRHDCAYMVEKTIRQIKAHLE